MAVRQALIEFSINKIISRQRLHTSLDNYSNPAISKTLFIFLPTVNRVLFSIIFFFLAPQI